MAIKNLTNLRPHIRLLVKSQNLLPRTTTRLVHPAHTPSSRRSKKPTSSITSPTDSGPIILEQPDAFRPPSHPARIRPRKPRMTYGRDLTEADYEHMESKTYPYSMPGRNTVMYKFMHSRGLHAFISLSVLSSLVLLIWILDFHKNNRYPDLLPHSSLFFRHPISFFEQYYSTWRLSQAEVDREHREKRDQRAQDVESRRLYRAKHDIPETTGITAWLGLGTKEEEERLAAKRERELAAEEQRQEEERRVPAQAGSENGEQRPVEKPVRKVFFGIWGW